MTLRIQEDWGNSSWVHACKQGMGQDAAGVLLLQVLKEEAARRPSAPSQLTGPAVGTGSVFANTACSPPCCSCMYKLQATWSPTVPVWQPWRDSFSLAYPCMVTELLAVQAVDTVRERVPPPEQGRGPQEPVKGIWAPLGPSSLTKLCTDSATGQPLGPLACGSWGQLRGLHHAAEGQPRTGAGQL